MSKQVTIAREDRRYHLATPMGSAKSQSPAACIELHDNQPHRPKEKC